jgi:anti-sigma regulatory factor (Ser/Thr protein kinase)
VGEIATSILLPPTADSPARARRFADEVRSRVGLSCDGLDLLVSELVTNAVRHASREIELTVTVTNDRICAQVRDDSPDAPRRREAASSHHSGRGLAIIEALAGGWTVIWHDDGTKTVAATLPCTPGVDRGAMDGRPGRS